MQLTAALFSENTTVNIFYSLLSVRQKAGVNEQDIAKKENMFSLPSKKIIRLNLSYTTEPFSLSYTV